MADTTLAAIRTLVRRLTRSPSETQLSNVDIDEYVNTFILYDFPAHLKLQSLTDNFVFYSEPDIDTYGAAYVDPNTNINTDKPAYIAGRQVVFSQSQEEFYSLYPKVNSIADTDHTGDGVTVAYAGTISNTPVLKGHVTFTSIGAANNGLELHDDSLGVLSGDGTGTIDYLTGDYTLNFSAAPASNKVIQSQTVPYKAGTPDTILYFKNEIIMRPIPDKPYRVELQVDIQPTELLAAGTSPDLKQWFQYIAYGAAKKVFEGRSDLESAALIMPEFKKQEQFVLRTDIGQQTKEQTATIYRQQTGNNSNSFFRRSM